MTTERERIIKNSRHKWGTGNDLIVMDTKEADYITICHPYTMDIDTVTIPNEHLRDIIRVLIKEQNRRGL